jgi:shikimate dehydrogenase
MSKKSFLVGLIGTGISASLSPAMHEEEARRLGISYVYRRIDLQALQLTADALPALLSAAEQTGFDGLNITYPCKQHIIPLLDELSDDARALGAVNTVLLQNGKRIGHNTDWSGFARAYQRGLPNANLENVVQLGAGGAGAAVAHAALMLGTKNLTIFDVDAARAHHLATELQTRFPNTHVLGTSSQNTEDTENTLANAMHHANGLIHATPTGMAKLPGMPLPATLLHKHLWVADIVYFPIRTQLLQAAETAGCRTLSGGGMAVYQAVDAFRLFTGMEPDAERMFTHFQTLLEP